MTTNQSANRPLEQIVIDELRTLPALLATVESCTGGLVASRLTNISGSSDVFWGGWVTYDNSAKELLGVSKAIVAEHGAVSPEVALAMARSGLAAMGSVDSGARLLFCIATTGIAGPTGGSDSKPVGLCYIACASSKNAITREIRAPQANDRTATRSFFGDEVLRLLLEQVPVHRQL